MSCNEESLQTQACLMPAVKCTATWWLALEQQARLQNPALPQHRHPSALLFAANHSWGGCRVDSVLHEHVCQLTKLLCNALWVCSGLAPACTCCQRRSPTQHSSSGSHAWALLRVVALTMWWATPSLLG